MACMWLNDERLQSTNSPCLDGLLIAAAAFSGCCWRQFTGALFDNLDPF